MKSLRLALLTTTAAVALGGKLAGSAWADESGLSYDEPTSEEVAPVRSTRGAAKERTPAVTTGRSGFGPRSAGPRVVLLDEPVQKDAPPVPLAADLTDKTLAMGLRTEPALAASLVGLGCLISWRRRSRLARRGAWAH